MTELRFAPAPKVLPLQVVNIFEQFPVVSEILLKFLHHFLAGVVAADWEGVFPLGCWEQLCPQMAFELQEFKVSLL